MTSYIVDAIAFVVGVCFGYWAGRRMDRRYVERVDQFEKRLSAIVALLNKREQAGGDDPKTPG